MSSKTICQAAAEDDTEALQHLLSQVNVPHSESGWTALRYAAENNAAAAAKMLLDAGADPATAGDAGDDVRPLLEEYRTPLPDHYRALVPATYLLTKLGDSQPQFEALKSHQDYRVQALAYECLKGPDPLHHDHGQAPQQPLDAETLANIQHLLASTRAELRLIGLEWALRQPDERLAPSIVPLLRGRSLELLEPASRLFRMCCTRDEQTLASIRPIMEFARPPKPIPADATPEQQKEITKKNNQQASDDYEIRRNALKALLYPHGSSSTRDYLLAYFDDPTRQLKRELNVAFQYCPDPAVIQSALKDRINGPDPLKTSALFALSHFHNPEHKALFLSHLQSPNCATAQGALRGIASHLSPDDLPALQECRDRWT